MGLLQISPPLSVVYVLIRLTLSSQSSFFISMIPSLSFISFMDPTFAVASKKSTLPHTKSSGFSPMLSSRSFMILCFIFKCVIHFELIFVNCIGTVSKFFFACGCPVVSAPFVEKTIFVLQNCFCSVVKDQQTVFMWVYFSALYSVPLACPFSSTGLSILLPVLHCLDCCGFIMRFEVWQCQSSNIVLNTVLPILIF